MTWIRRMPRTFTEQTHNNCDCPCFEEKRRLMYFREHGTVWHQACRVCRVSESKLSWLSVLTFLQDCYKAAVCNLSTLGCICSTRSSYLGGYQDGQGGRWVQTKWIDYASDDEY